MSRSAIAAVALLVLAGLLLAGVNLVGSSEQPEGATPEPTQSGNRWSVPVTMGEYVFDTGALSALPPGLAAFEVVNAGRKPHELQMFKMEEGENFVDFVEAVTNRGLTPKLFEIASPVGGVGAGGGLAPLESQRFTLDLELGSYVFVSFINNDNRKGMLKKFDVLKATSTPTGLPATEGTISLVDGEFDLPADELAQGTYALVNEGADVHEAAIFEVAGVTDELRAELEAGETESGAGGFSLLAPDRSSFAQLNLPSGSYAFVCRLINPASGQPYFEEGMLTEFEVQ